VAGGLLRRPVGIVLGGATAVVALVVTLVVSQPGLVVDPTTARIALSHGTVFQAAEDEIAAVQAGALGTQRHLWVTGTSMTVLTIDANLMPIIPLMLRPDATDAAVIAFGMGSTYRSALVAGLQADAVELVPSVPKMLQWFHPDADAVRSNPNGRIIVADGRNHLELTERRYDIIVTDPPPPIESSGASVISSYEYYLLGRSRLKPGGIMMQWLPYGPGAGDHNAHIRTFRAAFPHVTLVNGASGYGLFMLGSEAPIAFDDASIRAILARPGVLANLSEPADTPARTIDAWAAKIPTMVLQVDDEVDQRVGSGPLVTDDRPYSEYFLLRRRFFAPG
jgi:spermidine synthase